ncbi:ubiquitin-protein ligase-like protein [Massariosphaeria phaeospora]|uniref:Ubiquitin-protein ligase-like protein n=1 Tax=Massariosphaeria phaeospora TaxID=100035 RepID=A0A7C8MC51_9PLEO|nr:ubiquitin-protein ligase-like protein [Massariosphaeria phaeospora]
MEQNQLAAANLTSYLPSPADLLMAVPRLLSKAGFLGEQIDNALGKMRTGGSVIAVSTVANVTNATAAITSGHFVQESVAAAATMAAGSSEEIGLFQALKNVGSLFSYITSKWAISTFAVAILLNRTHFYASSRVPLSFDRFYLRAALYIVPMTLFLYRMQTVLQAIRCQTSPNWSELQYGAPGRELDTDFAGEGGLLWRASSALLFWQDLETSCRAVNMFPVDPGTTRPAGSLAILWPLFTSLGFGQFIETMSCALQGRSPIQEVGMTIFEHSLAFAEAEAVVTKPLALNSARFWQPKDVFTPSGTSLALSRTAMSGFANVPPEVLLISLISSFSYFTSNLLVILGLRARFRLVTTAIWGLAYMSTFAWSFLRLTTLITTPSQIGILRFPTVCIVGFIPHFLIIVGVLACGAIYLLAFGLTVLSPPPGQPSTLTWRERYAAAYQNLHANIHLSSITPLSINWNEDFYTAILKVGFTVLTAASEAVYLNEGTRINVNSMTWLEKKRLQDILERRRRFRQSVATIPPELRGDSLAEGVEVVDRVDTSDSNAFTSSGYSRERKTREATTTSDASRAVGRDNGVGIGQRRGRWQLTYHFLRGISRLLMAIQARILISLLRKLRITYRPGWLSRLAGPVSSEKPRAVTSNPAIIRSQTRSEPWLVVDEQTRVRPDRSFDVEAFTRDRLQGNGAYEEQEAESEEHLNDYLYGWWKRGGRWGDVDTSGDYVPTTQDDDTTSVMSFATTNEGEEWSDVDEDDDGQRTPTRDSFLRNRQSTPQVEDTLDLSQLSRLLDPKTQQEREEARILSRHLQKSGTLTRSQYRLAAEREEARILTSSRYRMDGFSTAVHMTPEEEERLLEDFILTRRTATSPHNASTAGTWNSGAEGMGSEGPQCVVCQLSPRTVLVWPCGCLSLCDDCRVGLASKNYTTCVCCRTSVVAYSRLYVP